MIFRLATTLFNWSNLTK